MQNKAKRVRYLRVLEKVANRFAIALKKENFDVNIFKSTVEQNLVFLKKIEPVDLNTNYNKNLEEFVNLCCYSDFDRDYLIFRLNNLRKIKRENQYAKDKHKNKIFNIED